MPQIWNHNQVVVKYDELVPHFWSSEEVLRVTLSRDSKKQGYGIKRVQLGGNGRESLIDFDTLPKHIQIELGDPRKVDHPLMMFYKTDSDAVKFYKDFKRPGIGYMKPEEYDRYITNANVVQALLKLEQARIQERISKGGSIRASKNVRSVPETILIDSITFNSVLKTQFGVEHNLPSHPRHFRRVLNEFRQNSYIALIKDAEGKSIKNAQKVDNTIISFLNNLFSGQDHKPSATEVSNQYDAFLGGYLEILNNSTGEIYNAKDFKKISKSTIKAYLGQWQNKIVTHSKRSGNRQQFMTDFLPFHKMEAPKYAGSLISIDDRQPPFKYPDGKSGKRMWYYIAIDLASEAITCWVEGETKQGLILNFYRQLVRNYHHWGVQLPFGLECESSLNSSFKNTFLQDGVMFQDVRIEANNARGKKIERYFGKLRYEIEKEHEGWIARPTALSERNQAGPKDVPLIPKSQIIENAVNDICLWNNTEHSTSKGNSRWNYFTQNQDPNLPKTNYKAILPYLGFHTESSVKAGMVNFRSGKFLLGDEKGICTGADLIDLMKQIEGKEIDIHWLDTLEGEIIKAVVLSKNDQRYICELHAMPVSNRAKNETTEAHRTARTIMSRYIETVNSFLKQGKSQLDQVTIIDSRPKVINNDFQLPGSTIKKEVEYFNDELEQFDDEGELVTVVPTKSKSLKDRF